MLWNGLINIVMFPVNYFWERYQKCKKENAVWKMICLFAFSLTGIAVILVGIAYAISIIIIKINERPEILFIVLGIVWLYLYGRSKSIKQEEQSKKTAEQLNRDKNELNANAVKGLPSITMFMFTIFRKQSDDIDCEKPLTSAEIQIPEEKFILRNGLCFYQFKLKKKCMQAYDREALDVFKTSLQCAIQNKLHSGDALSFEAHDVLDQFGNIFDAIVIDNIEDLGGYFQFSVVYASQAYAEFARKKQLIKMQDKSSNEELTASWDI